MEDPDYLRGVLLEVQRLWPPFIGGRRIADQVGLFTRGLICILLIIMYVIQEFMKSSVTFSKATVTQIWL